MIPSEALPLVALGVSLLTYGWGASLGASLCGAGTVGAEMVTAGVTYLSSSAATSFLSHGDLLRTAKDLFSEEGIRGLGTSLATAGLIGNGGSQAGLSLGQRLVANSFRTVVKSAVSSAIEGRSFGKTLEQGATGILVDSVSGALAQQIGKAAVDKNNPLTYGEHQAAHFALGAGMGAVLDRNHPLAGAVTGGMGAMMAEVIAESLVDRDQMMRQAMAESQQDGAPFDRDRYEDAYRAQLRPIVDKTRLIVGGVMTAFGQDPAIALVTAGNALENNFAGANSIPLPKIGQIPGINVGAWARETLVGLELSDLHEKVGLGDAFLKLVEDGTIQVHQTDAGKTYYVVHDELFETAEGAWKATAAQLPFCQSIEEKEWANGRTLRDTFDAPSFKGKILSVSNQPISGICLEKKAHDKRSASTSKSGAKSSAAGGTPSPDWEPERGGSKEKKEVTYPNNPDVTENSFKKIMRTKAKESLQDGSIWEPDMSQHGGEQWKMWKTNRSWKKGEQPASIWPDGRVRKWGDQ